MALALLDFQSVDRNFVLLAIDTGTNIFYRYKIGQSIASREGIDWVDDVIFTSSLVPRGGMPGDLLNSGATIRVPGKYFNREACYVQLFTFRNAQGLSPAYSRVLQIPVGMDGSAPAPFSQQALTPPALPQRLFSRPKSMLTMPTPSFNRTRTIPCPMNASSLARTTSVEGLLARIVELAVPVALDNQPVPMHHIGPYQAYGSPDLASGSLYNSLHRFLHRLGIMPTAGEQDEEYLPSLINAANDWRMRVRPAAAEATGAILTQSLGLSTDPGAGAGAAPSNKVLLAFETTAKTTWNGAQKTLYNSQAPVTVQLRIAIPGAAPAQPLPKAIFTFTVKDAQQQDLHFEKMERRKDIAPGSLQSFSFTKEEMSSLPLHTPLNLFAEIRWLSADGLQELNAVGCMELLLTGPYFLKQQGPAVSDEFELADMTRYRAFWNKIWESPVLDTAGMQEGSSKKYGWEINVNGKYFLMLTPGHDANGLMGTRLLPGPPQEEDAVRTLTEGRMKAGIELSIKELNKLLPVINDRTPLNHDQLQAFLQDDFARDHSTEFIYHFRLQGKAGERGMIWVIPIFKLFEFTLNKIQTTDVQGVVTQVTEEKVCFPLPVAARSIGLKSE